MSAQERRIAAKLALVDATIEAKQLPPIPFVWARDVTVDFEAEQLVEDLMYPGSFVLTYGESNTGKTFLVFDLCVAITQGQPWFGRDTKKGLVVYIAGEGYLGVALRKTAYETRGRLAPDANLAIVQRAVDFLSDSRDVENLITLVKELETQCGEKCVLIVIDTLQRAIPGGSDNESSDMGAFVKGADTVRTATGSAVLAIHHAGKDVSKGARGHSSLRAAVDTELLVEGQADPRTVTCTKQRDLERAPAFTFELEVQVIGHNRKGKPVTSCLVRTSDMVTNARSTLSAQQKLAFDCLREALKEDGEAPPTSLIHGTKMVVPSRVLAITKWRDVLRRRDIVDGGDDAFRKAFQRSQQKLQEQKLIYILDGYVWLLQDKRT